MRSLWAGLLVSMACAPGLAAETTRKEPACRLYERHVPVPDVAFQPGKDVHGRPVAGADLPGSAVVDPPESFDFVLSLSPLEY